MTALLTFLLSNFTLTFLLVALASSAFTLFFRHAPPASAPDIFLRNFIFWGIGATYLYNFVMHVFFAEMVAGFIGWANSPFQYEVGFASFGFSAVAFFGYRSSFDFRLASILGPSFFLWGAAIGHIYQIITKNNFAPGNAGIILFTDILTPFIGFFLLWLQYRNSQSLR